MNRHKSASEPGVAWLFMAPALLGLALFILMPFILAIGLSFTNVRLGSPLPVEWVGWREYARLLGDAAFLRALFNNLLFAAVVVPVQTLLALGLALWLNRPLRGRVLAAALLAYADPVEALTRYQDQRIAAMNAIIIRNRNFGPETVLQLAEERAPDGFTDLAEVLSKDELEQAALGFKRAAGIDVETVNSRDSLVPSRAA